MHMWALILFQRGFSSSGLFEILNHASRHGFRLLTIKDADQCPLQKRSNNRHHISGRNWVYRLKDFIDG